MFICFDSPCLSISFTLPLSLPLCISRSLSLTFRCLFWFASSSNKLACPQTLTHLDRDYRAHTYTHTPHIRGTIHTYLYIFIHMQSQCQYPMSSVTTYSEQRPIDRRSLFSFIRIWGLLNLISYLECICLYFCTLLLLLWVLRLHLINVFDVYVFLRLLIGQIVNCC